MPKFFFLLLLATTPPNKLSAINLQVGNINFSGCTLSGPQNLTGDLTAHGAQFGSLIVNGLANLANTSVSEKLIVMGEIDCNNCILESVAADGPSVFHRTLIKKKLKTTGSTECKDNCTIGEIETAGNLTVDASTVLGSMKATGKLIKINNSTFLDGTIKGTFKGKNLIGNNLWVTGNSNFSNSTLTKSAEFVGLTKLTESVFNNLIVTGKTKIINSKASDATIIGKLDAENCEFKSLTLEAETATLTNCTIEILYAQKEASIIRIKGLEHTPRGSIKKIITDNPKTQIIYEELAPHAREVIGTTLIKIIQKN